MNTCRIPIAFAFLVAVSSALAPKSGHADIVSTFDAGDEGWRRTGVFSFANPPVTNNHIIPVSWGASAGKPGGGVFFAEAGGIDDFFLAPAKFLGNQSFALHGMLSFDERTSRGIADPSNYLLILVGGGMTLVYQDDQPTTAWMHHDVPLNGSDWLKIIDSSTTVPATDSDLLGTLSSLSALYVQGDWTAISDETSYLDNVALRGVPEPSTLALLGIICLGLVGRRAERSDCSQVSNARCG